MKPTLKHATNFLLVHAVRYYKYHFHFFFYLVSSMAYNFGSILKCLNARAG